MGEVEVGGEGREDRGEVGGEVGGDGEVGGLTYSYTASLLLSVFSFSFSFFFFFKFQFFSCRCNLRLHWKQEQTVQRTAARK